MKDQLLVGTYQKLFVHANGKNHTIHSGHGPYWGVTWGDDKFYVGIRRNEGRVANNAMQVHSRDFMSVRTFPLGGVDQLHQIFYWDGFVYIANTGLDTVVRWREREKVKEVYQCSPAGRDTKHVNSIWCDGEKFYICEHTGRPSRVKVFSMDWKLLETWNVGREIHNVYVEDGKLYVNSSHFNAICIKGIDSGKERMVKLSDEWGWNPPKAATGFRKVAYTRGMARTDNRFYIGLSAVLPRDDRYAGPSAVLEFDNSFNFIGRTEFPRTGGLYDIRVMNKTDRAHNKIKPPWRGPSVFVKKPTGRVRVVYNGPITSPFSIRGEKTGEMHWRIVRGKPLGVSNDDVPFFEEQGFSIVH